MNSPAVNPTHLKFSQRTLLLLGLLLLLLPACSGAGQAAPVDPTSTARPTVQVTPTVVESSSTLAAESPEPTLILPPTNTPLSTLAEEDQAAPTIRPSRTPTSAPPTPSPTAAPQVGPTIPGYALPTHTPFGAAVTAETPEPDTDTWPTPVPAFETSDQITNVLLLGTDAGGTNTDAMIIVSINSETHTATMLSLPRDLYVFIPELKRMERINTAFAGGIDRLKQTILYNFGVSIHYFAQVEFEGFKEAVDLLGGLEVAVSCGLRDWRLKSAELDPENEDNWAQFTLEPGVHHMDGDTALWYVRSRRTTSDFDRGRRQQQLLRDMLEQGVELNLITQLPSLWETYRDSVRTDMDIGRMLQLAALAPSVRQNGIQHLYIVGEQIKAYTVPGSGAQVQLPQWEYMQDTFRRLTLPPALYRAGRPPITVEIINASGNPHMAILAEDNLAWYGFEPVLAGEAETQDQTTIRYYAQNRKGSFDWLLSWVVDKRRSDVELVTDAPSDYNYQIVLGREYDPCRPQLYAPRIFLDQ
ncbi:MAG: LCP family protein [Candidatus Promineifilaceae bacterium]|nr:LCP family protein [Candidatus Promineifilaceae bacterium]